MHQTANYHTHTIFSDGRAHPELYIKNAMVLGHTAIGFSDHAPIPGHPTRWNMPADRLEEYFQTLTQLREQYEDHIQIKTALEIDYIEGVISPSSVLFLDARLDYTIGSVHFLKGGPEGDQWWDYESSPDQIEAGIRTLFDNDIKAIIRQYYRNMRAMIRGHCPDILAHFDRIKVINQRHIFFDEMASWYQNEVVHTLEELAATDAILEVNTKGMYARGDREPYPSGWILQKAGAMDIPVHLAADAHSPENLAGAFTVALQQIEQAGYKFKTEIKGLNAYRVSNSTRRK